MSKPWYKDPVTQGFNPPVEPGEDIGTPFHTPITALLPGTVAGVTYGGYGARVDVMTAQGDVYYQHLDTVDVKVGQRIVSAQQLGLSGGQLFGGNLPNSPLNSTGPHVEFGFGGTPRDPSAMLAAGPVQDGVGVGGGGSPDQAAAVAAQQQKANTAQQSSGAVGGLVNVNFPDPIAGLRDWVGSGLNQLKSGLTSGAQTSFVGQNIIPLAVAAVIILIVLGSGQKTQTVPQPVPVPVPV